MAQNQLNWVSAGESNPEVEPAATASHSHAQFTQTHWSMVLAAQAGRSPTAQDALARLCQIYWYPLYAFIRRRGCAPHDAQDLTQGFFAHLFQHEILQKVERERGKFRTFLLASLTNFLNNDWDKKHALKRGGTCEIISLDLAHAEQRYGQEPAHDLTPERVFERRWAAKVVEQVQERLIKEYAASRQAELCAALQPALAGGTATGLYAEVAGRLGMTEGAVKVAMHRMRRRFGELLRQEVAQTVARPEEIQDELRYLLAAWLA